MATAGTDITVTFDGESNDGVFKWMEDEDYFEFSDDLLIASTEKIQFRDSAIYINSSADGQLDIVADSEIQIAATTIDINGNVDISGTLTIGGAGISEAELEILDGATVTTTEINILDGDTTASSTTVADADRVVFNDAGTMKQVAVTDLAAYFDDEITAMPNLVTTAATTVGALNSGSITSGFGTIDTGSSTITTTGLISGGSLDIDDVLINGTTIGHTDDTDLITLANGVVTVAGEVSMTTLDIGGTNVTSTATELNLLDGVSGLVQADFTKLAAVDSTAAELNIVDGGTSATSTTVADADRVVMNDNGTMVQVAVTDLAAYFDDEITAMPNLVTTAATTVGALNSGSITSGFGTIDTGSSAITTTGVITGGTLEATTDTAAGDNAAIGYTAAEGLILTGQGSTSDITLKNDADAVVFTVPTGTDDILFPDDAKAMFGAGSDLQIYHDGSNSYIDDSGTGSLIIQASNSFSIKSKQYSNVMVSGNDDGDVQLFHNGTSKLSTASGGVSITGNVIATGTVEPAGDTAAGDNAAIGYTAAEGLILTGQGSTSDITLKNDADATVFTVPTGTDDILFPDNAKILMGAGSDLQIYHDGSHSIIRDAGTGNLKLWAENFSVQNSNGSEQMILATPDGSANLYYNGTKKFETTATGVSVTGDVVASGAIEPAGDTAAGDNAAVGYTSAEGLILTGQGSTNDVTIKNDADADVLEIPTGTTNVAVVGSITSGGAAVKVAGKETIWVPASAMQPTTSNGCSDLTTVETTSGRPDLVVLDFDKDSDEFAQFSVAFPKSWNAGTVTFQVFWAGIAATTDVDWMVDAVAISNNTTIDVAYGTAVVVTDNAQGAVEELNVSAESGALTIAGSPGDDELCFFRIGRDVSGDAMAGDARLVGIKLFFTTDLANDG